MTANLLAPFVGVLIGLIGGLLLIGIVQCYRGLAWHQRPAPVRLPAPEDNDPDVVASAEMMIIISDARRNPEVEPESP